MPFDEYKCPKCGVSVDLFRNIKDDAPTFVACNSCKTDKVTAFMKKQIPAGVSVAWKGGAPTKKFY